MSNSARGFATLIILAIVAGLIIFGGAGWWLHMRPQTALQDTGTSSSVSKKTGLSAEATTTKLGTPAIPNETKSVGQFGTTQLESTSCDPSPNGFTSVKALCPSGKLDAHLEINNTYRTVTFCDHTYKTIQVIIDGVDVIQRLAQVADEEICFNINENNPEKDANAVLDVTSVNSYTPLTYYIQISASDFEVTLPSRIISNFTFVGDRPIGTLK